MNSYEWQARAQACEESRELLKTQYVLLFERAERAEAERDKLRAELAALREQRDKLQAFKDWTHKFLDTHGVPHHPPGPHGAEGCRIGDRMDWLMAQMTELQKENASLRRGNLDLASHLQAASEVLSKAAERGSVRPLRPEEARVIRAADRLCQCLREFAGSASDPTGLMACGENLDALENAVAECPGTTTHTMDEAAKEQAAKEKQ